MASQVRYSARPMSLATKISRELMCSICLGEFHEPKLLPCGHSFCLRCIEKYVRSTKDVFNCPECNTEIKSPTGGISEFTTDFRVTALQSIVSEQRSKRGRDDKCRIHGESQVGYCKVCEEILCGRCVLEHTRQKHDICELQEELDERKGKLATAIDEKTKDIAQYNKDVSHAQARQTKLERHLVDTEEKVQQWAKEVHESVKKTEMLLLEEIQQTIKPDIRGCEDRIKDVERLTDILSKSVTQAQQIDDKMLMEDIDGCLSMLNTGNDKITPLPQLSMYKFETPEITWPILEKLKPLPSKPPRLSKGKTSRGPVDVSSRELGLHKVGEIPYMLSDDTRSPLIKEMSISPMGDVVVLDHSNQNVKCFELSGNLRWKFAYNTVERNGVPCSISVFPSRCVGVTKQQDEKMDIISIKSGNKIKEVHHGVNCLFPLVAVKGSEAIICDTSEATIHIYTVTSEGILTKTGLVPSIEGHPILDCRSFVHLDNTIVVTDLKNRKIHSLTLKGQEVFTYNTDQDDLYYPRSICTDVDGNVLVADQESNKIVQLTPSGQFVKVLLNGEDGLKKPTSIAMLFSQRKLLIADRSNIKVYQS